MTTQHESSCLDANYADCSTYSGIAHSPAPAVPHCERFGSGSREDRNIPCIRQVDPDTRCLTHNGHFSDSEPPGNTCIHEITRLVSKYGEPPPPPCAACAAHPWRKVGACARCNSIGCSFGCMLNQRDEALKQTHDLRFLINTPNTEDFFVSVRLEAAHQVERYGSAHDAGKQPSDWFWLLGYLGGKALAAALAGERTKALHHTISSAAVLLNWHRALSGNPTAMRPGTKQ